MQCFVLFYLLITVSTSAFCAEERSLVGWEIEGDFSNDMSSYQRHIVFESDRGEDSGYFGVAYYERSKEFEGWIQSKSVGAKIADYINKGNVTYYPENDGIHYIMEGSEFKNLLKVCQQRNFFPSLIFEIMQEKIKEIIQ